MNGLTVLVVEDDYYIAADTASALRSAGASVPGPCPSEESAYQLLPERTPTAAVLDLNMGGGGPKAEVARYLLQQRVPFLFLTGYDLDVILEDFSTIERLKKPVSLKEVVEAVARVQHGV